MSTFSDDEATHSRLDYRALRDSFGLMYFSNDILARDLGWLRAEGYLVHDFDCAAWVDEPTFHAALATGLSFPDYYGHNLDALNDCLGDLAVPDVGGCVILLRRVDVFAARLQRVALATLDILAGVSRRNMLHGRRLLGLLQSDDPRLTLAPVGGVPVLWNPSEWLNSQRGV